MYATGRGTKHTVEFDDTPSQTEYTLVLRLRRFVSTDSSIIENHGVILLFMLI